MSRPRRDQPLRESVLDRLIAAEAPGRARETPRLEDLKAQVRRDLETLLNSRCRCIPPPDDLPELGTSVIGYGIPDFTGLDLATERQRDAFVARIEGIIRRFEPRFVEVEAARLENADPNDRTLRLRIEALMHAEPAPEPLVFSSALDPVSGTFSVTGGTDV